MIKRIREIRKNLHLTQERFAEKLGVSRDLVAGWEVGKSKPTTEVLIKMAELGNVKLMWLIKGGGDNPFESPPRLLDIS